MLSIGEISKLTDCKVQTIRHYEQIGLLTKVDRNVGGQRQYTPQHRDRLAFIRHARQLGFSLDQIRSLLELQDHPEQPCSGAHDIAEAHLKEVRSRIKALRLLERELKEMMCDDPNKTAQNCKIVKALADNSLCCTKHPHAAPKGF